MLRLVLTHGPRHCYQRTVSSTWAGIFGPDCVTLTHVMRHVYVPLGSGS
jgi:hypothetical protein